MKILSPARIHIFHNSSPELPEKEDIHRLFYMRKYAVMNGYEIDEIGMRE